MIQKILDSPVMTALLQVAIVATLVLGVINGVANSRNQARISTVADKANARSTCQAAFNRATNDRAVTLLETTIVVNQALDRVEIAGYSLWSLTADLIRKPATTAEARAANNLLFLERLDSYNSAIAGYNVQRAELVKKQAQHPLPKVEDYCDYN